MSTDQARAHDRDLREPTKRVKRIHGVLKLPSVAFTCFDNSTSGINMLINSSLTIREHVFASTLQDCKKFNENARARYTILPFRVLMLGSYKNCLQGVRKKYNEIRIA
ncbi:MAG TPA: hypothetical protein VKM55_30245 [Candidatus Lokiarchaeia archaeon]|nr:hypothetical protein [Candidatus Lokiarchaeia archaeon]